MKISQLIMILLVLNLSANNPICADDTWTEEKIFKLQQDIISQRKSITSYDVTIKLNSMKQGRLIGPLEIKERYDGKKVYKEIFWEYMNSKRISIQNGDFDGYSFEYEFSNDAQLKNGSFIKGEIRNNDLYFVDFSKIGLLPYHLSSTNIKETSIEDVFNCFSKHSNKPIVSLRELDRKPVVLIAYVMSNATENEAKFWIDLDQGPSIVRCEFGSKDRHVSVTNKIEKHILSGKWFPIYSEYVMKENDKVVEYQKLDITIHSLNTPIDPKLFQVTGIGLPPGTTISGDPVSRQQYVINDKNELVSPDAFGTPEPEPKERSKWWGRAAIITAVLTLIVGVIYLRKRRLQNSLGGE